MNYFENQWVEIFRAGEQTDSVGNTRDWTESDLEKIVNQYNAKKHEAPVVIGHPKENAPAFGWVEDLKTDGRVLFAKFKQLVPEFIDAVKNGMYKKRSISLYPDFTLRHVGFLGAIPPAVKGLADIQFNETDNITIEFSTPTRGADQMIEKDRKINELRAQLRAEQKKNRVAEFKEFAGKLHSEGRIVSELQNNVVELMEALYETGEYNFSDGRTNTLVKFKEYLKKQPKIVEFGEKVKEEKISGSKASEQLNILAVEKAKEKQIRFSDALSLVQVEYPDLATKAAQEI
ncbi:MAG: hypothetical protein A2Y25_11995 [Candidatus Melainabacteria bacterium GWF2_37_15]|nr:MAG: hypothetical protein A2Y25_11995 [Candidatus Melainabacteria bacterium GWF2_37_15]